MYNVAWFVNNSKQESIPIPFPYTIGETYDEVCDVCKNWSVMSLSCESCSQTRFKTYVKGACICKRDCPSCKGKPTKKKIKDIQVKDNNFIIYKKVV
jgi:hypothetical protein